MHRDCVFVMLVVLLAHGLKQLTNLRSSYAFVYMMAVHTAFHCELVSSSPSAMTHDSFCFSDTNQNVTNSASFCGSLLTGIDDIMNSKGTVSL